MPNLPNCDTEQKLMPGEAARMLGVTTKTLSKIKTLHQIVLPSGHRRYWRAEVEELASKHAA